MTDWAALRRVLAEQDDDYRARYSDEELSETPMQRKARLREELDAKLAAREPLPTRYYEGGKPMELPKGTCHKCRKHIGRGVHFHLKACNG